MDTRLGLLLVWVLVDVSLAANVVPDHRNKTHSMLFKRRILQAEKPPLLYPKGELTNLQIRGGSVHRPNENAIFALAYYHHTVEKLQDFVGSARQFFHGDIVLGIKMEQPDDVLSYLSDNNVIVYQLDLVINDRLQYHFSGCPDQDPIPLALIRFYLYQYWAALYNPNALLMLTDARDVYFQSNPFDYKSMEWRDADLLVFLETHPNKVINRCKFNGPWIGRCYGKEAVKRIGYNVISCSGVTMGTRDGILVYVYTVAKQTNPFVRNRFLRLKDPPEQEKCLSKGMDQGIHNWLLYSGLLGDMMTVAIFPQGEGPVNTLGGFSMGTRKLLNIDLTAAKVLREGNNGISVHNWNGDKSPVVHQGDRFNLSGIRIAGSRKYLKVMR